MNANLAERTSDGLIAGSPTDELCQVEPGLPGTEIREPAELTTLNRTVACSMASR